MLAVGIGRSIFERHAMIPPSGTPKRTILVETTSKRVPLTVFRLAVWQYLERSIHRMLCGWSRHQTEWEDVASIHRQIWDQAEIVNRLRQRIEQFPGGKADAPVNQALQAVVETVIDAPNFEDAMDGIFDLLGSTLNAAYRAYVASVHPVHDAPTVSVLNEIIDIRDTHEAWIRSYRIQRPHRTDSSYRERVTRALDTLNQETVFDPPGRSDPGARPVGVGSGFRLPARPGRPSDSGAQIELFPYIRSDFTSSIEARRLFWAIGYMREKNLAIEMVRWLFDGHHMPWEWTSDVSRHLWDESRHGDSGFERLKDWDIDLNEVGLIAHDSEWIRKDPPDGMTAEAWANEVTRVSQSQADDSDKGILDPMTPAELYEAVFFICMIAEQGHFTVKNEAYDDFKGGQDLESAEMMLFDIIDETTHVQYGHKWLPELARQADLDNSGYRERAAAIRNERQADEISGTERCQRLLPRQPGFAPWDHYQNLLRRIRDRTPLTNAATCQKRSPKPM